jgi:hypothetical protein
MDAATSPQRVPDDNFFSLRIGLGGTFFNGSASYLGNVHERLRGYLGLLDEGISGCEVVIHKLEFSHRRDPLKYFPKSEPLVTIIAAEKLEQILRGQLQRFHLMF